MSATSTLSTDEINALGEAIAETCALLDAATHRLLADVRHFDDVHGWYRQGAASMAHWLNWRAGIALGAAREKVRVARALASLPCIDEALRRGEISYSKCRAMTRVATIANEAPLLEQARHTTASQLERICKLFRQTMSPGIDDAEGNARSFRIRETDDGRVRITVELPPDEAEKVVKACEALAESSDRAEGLVAIAEAALRGDAPARPPVEVLLHIDAETLQGNTEAGDGLSAETCCRLLCDAGVVPVLEDREGAVLDVGRKQRIVPPAIRRALLARDGGCRFPGCTHRRFVEAHHVKHWAFGGKTSLENMLLLCTHHHRRVHEEGFSIREGRPLVFVDPAGQSIPEGPRAPMIEDGVERLRERAELAAVHIAAETAFPRWDGTPVDWNACMDALRPRLETLV